MHTSKIMTEYTKANIPQHQTKPHMGETTANRMIRDQSPIATSLTLPNAKPKVWGPGTLQFAALAFSQPLRTRKTTKNPPRIRNA